MGGHSKELWVVSGPHVAELQSCPDFWRVHDSSDDSYEGAIGEIWEGNHDGKANARRIVACVNACAGIPTEALEQGVVAEMRELIGLAFAEFNDIRARDGAPQHIDWHRGQPLQTSSCTEEWWNELTERLNAARRKLEPTNDQP